MFAPPCQGGVGPTVRMGAASQPLTGGTSPEAGWSSKVSQDLATLYGAKKAKMETEKDGEVSGDLSGGSIRP